MTAVPPGWPADCVLLALHYQNEVLHADGKIRLGVAGDSSGRPRLAAAALTLMERARRHQIPIIHVRIAFPPGFAGVVINAPIFRNVAAARACEDGTWGADFHEGLGPRPGETVVTHQRINAFFDSTLEQELRRLSPARLVMAGIATNSVVEHSARHAADMGYEVSVVPEACSAARLDVHQAALDNIALIGSLLPLSAITSDA